MTKPQIAKFLSQPSKNKKSLGPNDFEIEYLSQKADMISLGSGDIPDEIAFWKSDSHPINVHNTEGAYKDRDSLFKDDFSEDNKFNPELGYRSKNINKNMDQIGPIDHDEYEDEQSLIDQIGAESYFETFHKSTLGKKKGPSATSNNTLALLEKLDKVEKKVHSKKNLKATKTETFFGLHATELSNLTEFYKTQYKQWLFELENGFNLLFYGFGSKKDLVKEFCEEMILDSLNPVIVINGFHPNLNFKSVLDNIVLNVLNIPKHSVKLSSINDSIEEISTYFRVPSKYNSIDVDSLTLLINNIDGISLRKDIIQQSISYLASVPGIHLVATIDHINAPLMWDSQKLFYNGFNFIWHNLTNYSNYTEETGFENYQILHQHNNLNSNSSFSSFSISNSLSNSSSLINLSSVQHVMASLTSNAKNIFYKLAQFQIDSALSSSHSPISANDTTRKENIADIKEFPGMEYFSLYNACKESFLVSNELTFRSLLTEFKDHKIIVFSNDNQDGSQLLHIPLSSPDLKLLIES
ncbi:Origin recognition complex subunit 2 [Smittium mucronatum]|uniref:Origin recognition complex subunit 2 n=1 Tax=Smittium mucronatum TaxID=133383 RepID=A0A1R0H6Q6_9FUNG|nr:Origin recognition complex subunit 2 [Smittium mucronatum]